MCGGILIQHAHVLCQTASSENFFFLPGGRAQLGEAASVSLLREMQEELGVLMKIERLLYVVENFFTEPNDSWHELGLYFLNDFSCRFISESKPGTITRVDEVGNHLRFEWLPIAQLETFALSAFFSESPQKQIPECTVYIEEHSSRSDKI